MSESVRSVRLTVFLYNGPLDQIIKPDILHRIVFYSSYLRGVVFLAGA